MRRAPVTRRRSRYWQTIPQTDREIRAYNTGRDERRRGRPPPVATLDDPERSFWTWVGYFDHVDTEGGERG